jgi:hypothetical protein
MALTTGQRRIAEKIDARMRKLIRAGGDNMAIMAAMADHMPAFHRLLSTARPGDIEQLIRELPGFYRYAKILESLATGIQSGAIPVPGRKEPPRRTTTATDHRQRAAAMDLRMRQLADEGVPRSAIIDRMTAYVVDLGKIWNATTDDQLAALCDAYPGFHAYAVLMEEAAEAERRKPARPYDENGREGNRLAPVLIAAGENAAADHDRRRTGITDNARYFPHIAHNRPRR